MSIETNTRDAIENVFGEYLTSDIIKDIQSVLTNGNLSQNITELLASDIVNYKLEGYEEFVSKIQLKNIRLINMLKLTLIINDIFRQTNVMAVHNSPLGRFIIPTSMDTKKSDDSGEVCQSFKVFERVLLHMYLLCDIIANHTPDSLSKFIVTVDKLAGKQPLYTVIHALYHTETLQQSIRDAVVDTYMVISMICNMAFNNKITDGYISMDMFVESCTTNKCKMIKWVDPCLWSMILHNGIYLRHRALKQLNESVHDNFIKSHGGQLLNLMSAIFIKKKHYDIMYNLGIIYSLVYTPDPAIFSEKGIITYEYEKDGTVKYIANINDLTFQASNNVITVAYPDNGKTVVKVIEKQTDGYVYFDVNSHKDLNFEHVEYYTQVSKSFGTALLTMPEDISNSPKIKFNKSQMINFNELFMFLLTITIIYIIVSKLAREFKEKKIFKSRVNNEYDLHPSDDTNKARVVGGLNPNIPGDVESFRQYY